MPDSGYTYENDNGITICHYINPNDPDQGAYCEFVPNNNNYDSSNPPPPGGGQPQPSPANQPQPTPPTTTTSPPSPLNVSVREGLRVIEGRQRSAAGTGEECGILGSSGRNRQVESHVWDNPQFVAADGGSASIQLNDNLSDDLLAQDFGFAVPPNAQIQSISICIKRRVLG